MERSSSSPRAIAPPGTKNEISSRTEPTKIVQNEAMLSRGKAMSRAPTISGIRKLPNAPSSTGIATKNTIVVPCIVTTS